MGLHQKRLEEKMSQTASIKKTSPIEPSKVNSQDQPTIEEIRRRAYEIYLSRNGAPGDEVQDWLRAETEIRPLEP